MKNLNKRNVRTAIAASIAMLVLILDSKTALSGAAEGIDLCLKTLVPSLFPYFVLSGLLTGALYGQPFPFLRPVASLCGIPAGAASLFVVGLLGGYPAGARNVSEMHRIGLLPGKQASRMIVFCNNAGPSFIFGILKPLFSDSAIPWLLWGIHILSAMTVGMILPRVPDDCHVRPSARQFRMNDVLYSSLHAMACVCGWVILMRVVLNFLDQWILRLLPVTIQVALSGLLELSNGCIRLTLLQEESLRFLIASAMLALGGICITLQTASVADGVPMYLYFPGKLIQCCASILLASLLCPLIFPGSPCPCYIAVAISATGISVCMLSLRKFKNSSGIPAVVGV